MRKIFYTILAFIFLFSTALPLPIQAEQVSDEITNLNQMIEQKRKEVELLRKNIGSYKSQITNLQKKATTLQDRLKTLNNGIQRAKKEIELTQLQIEQTQLEIEELNQQIQFKTDQTEKKQEEIKTILQKIDLLGGDYISNKEEDSLGLFDIVIKFVKIIVKYDSWSAYANTLETSKDINHLLVQKKIALEELKKELEAKKGEREDKKRKLENSHKILGEKKSILTQEKQAKKILLQETQANEAKYQALLKQAVQREQGLAEQVNKLQQELRNKLAALNQRNPFASMIWPVPNLGITTAFGGPGYLQRVHNAIDIRAPENTPVRAPADGVVIAAVTRNRGACKNTIYACDYTYVKIAHSDTIASFSLHLKSITVSVGQEVNQGDIIGYSGGVPGRPGTGYFIYPAVPASTGPHLHFAVTQCINGSYLEEKGCKATRAINPLKYLP